MWLIWGQKRNVNEMLTVNFNSYETIFGLVGPAKF